MQRTLGIALSLKMAAWNVLIRSTPHIIVGVPILILCSELSSDFATLTQRTEGSMHSFQSQFHDRFQTLAYTRGNTF